MPFQMYMAEYKQIRLYINAVISFYMGLNMAKLKKHSDIKCPKFLPKNFKNLRRNKTPYD